MSKKAKKYFNATLAAAVAASAVAVPAITEASTFKDVQPNHQFYDAIAELANRGVISGFPDGTFKTNNHLTRGQAAKIIAGVLGLDTKNVANPGFKDVSSTNEYYGAIAALKAAGIIDGYEDGTYRSGNKIQRNHMAKIIANAMGLKAKDVDALPFTDVSGEYKEVIAALYENSVTTGKTATTFDGVANVTRGQMAAFIVRAENTAKQVTVDGNTITFTVSNYETNRVTVGDAIYTYDTAVNTIFTEANKAALAGATMTVTVEEGVITKVNNIVFNTAGDETTPLTFETSATIDALTVNADYVTVKDVTVTGDVTVTNKVTNAVDFDTVTINGNLVVDEETLVAVAALDNSFAKGDKKGPKVKMKNSKVNKVHVKRDFTAIESDQAIGEMTVAAKVTSIQMDGTVMKLNVESTASLEISGAVTFEEVVVVAAAQLALNILGVIEALVVNSADAKITVATSVTVSKLTVPSGSKAENIIANFTDIAKQILAVATNKATAGGSGGGSSSSSDNDDNDDTTQSNNNKGEAEEVVATENLTVTATLRKAVEKLENVQAIVGGKTYTNVASTVNTTTNDVAEMTFNVEIPKGTEIQGDDKITFTVTYVDGTTETVVVYYWDGVWNVAPQRSIVALDNDYGYGADEQILVKTTNDEVIFVNYTFKNKEVYFTWVNGVEIKEGERFKVEKQLNDTHHAFLQFVYENGVWKKEDEFLGRVFVPEQEQTQNMVFFTFAPATSQDVATIDVTTVDVTAINGIAVATADIATVDIEHLVITFNNPYTVTTGDEIEISVIRPNKMAREVYTITFTNGQWVAKPRVEEAI